MAQRSVLREEIAEHQRAIGRVSEEIRTIQNFIKADERNIQHPVEAIRTNAHQSLENYRGSLTIKELTLRDLQETVQAKQTLLAKLEEVARKEQEGLRLEQERDRIAKLYDNAQSDLQLLSHEINSLPGPVRKQQAALIIGGGQRIPLPAHQTEMLVGCTDAADGIFPAIDLTPFGGTTSGVSRRHATLSQRNGQWSITDENSTNGTFLNGTRLPANVPRALSQGATLRFGTVEAQFTLSGSQPSPKTTRLS